MRCPKCHYLSFEPEPRCKNCGYDLAFGPDDLNTEAPAADQDEGAASLTILPPPPPTPAYIPPALGRESVMTAAAVRSSSAVAVATPPSPFAAVTLQSAPVTAPIELPLFVQSLEPEAPRAAVEEIEIKTPDTKDEIDEIEDEPLVKLPRAPRPPLAVRRPTPAPGRVREKYHREPAPTPQAGLLELDEPGTRDPAPGTPSVWPSMETHVPALPAEATNEGPVGAGRRIEAACVDVLFLGLINAAVVWLTLQRCDLTIGQIGALPLLPVAAFLFVLNGCYLLMFTAVNGQTIGKMVAGIRVVGASDDGTLHDRVTLGQATLRALLTFPSVFAVGAGFVPALIGARLALHDRFTHTRVVRA